MRANMRNFSANNRGGKYASGGGYSPGKFARSKSGSSTSGS